MVAPVLAGLVGGGLLSGIGSIFGGRAAQSAAQQAAQTSLLGLQQARRAGFAGQQQANLGRRRAERAFETAAATTAGGLERARQQAEAARKVAAGATTGATEAAERAAATTLAGLDRQRATAERVAALTGEATETGIGRLDPFAAGGTGQFNQLLAEQDALTRPFTLEDFETSPGFQFRLQQGEEAINRAAAARGQFFAPASVQRLNEFNQGLAAEEFNQAFLRNRTQRQDRLNALLAGTGVGLTASQNIANLAQQGAGQQGTALLSVPELQGAAQAAAFQQSIADILQRGAQQEQAAILSTPELQGAAQQAAFQGAAGSAAQTAAAQAIQALTGVPYVQGANAAAQFQLTGGEQAALGLTNALNTFANTAAAAPIVARGLRQSTFNAPAGGSFAPGSLTVNASPNLAPTQMPGFSFI